MDDAHSQELSNWGLERKEIGQRLLTGPLKAGSWTDRKKTTLTHRTAKAGT